jgi:hypothetical protein
MASLDIVITANATVMQRSPMKEIEAARFFQLRLYHYLNKH